MRMLTDKLAWVQTHLANYLHWWAIPAIWENSILVGSQFWPPEFYLGWPEMDVRISGRQKWPCG